MLALMIAARRQSPIDVLAAPPDFIVTNAAEWNAVFANSAATLANKIVEVAAPIPEAVAITNRDFIAAGGPVSIRSANQGAYLGHLDLITLVRGVNFSRLNFQLQGWPKAQPGCVEFKTGTFDQLRFDKGTRFRHGYGPGLADCDTAANLPEYERINNVQTATTSSQTFPLVWKDPAATSGMVEFFNRGTGSVRVAIGGGGVVATGASQLVAPGTRFRFSNRNPVTDTSFAILATTGSQQVNARSEIGLAYYLGRAFTAQGSAQIQNIEIRNCVFRDLGDGVKSLGTPTRLVVMDNDFDRVYGDIIAVSLAVGGSARILRNISSIAFCRSGIAENLSGDAGDPHGDVVQIFGTGIGAISDVRVAGNRMRVGALRSGVSNQGVFISDNDVFPGYRDISIISDMFIGGAPSALAVGETTNFPVRDVMIYGVSVADYANAGNLSPRIAIDTDDGGSIYVGRSIAPTFQFSFGIPQQDNNLSWGAVVNSAAVFPGLANLAAASNRLQIEAAMTTAAEGIGRGAVATTNAIDWMTSDPESVVVWENVPSGAHWNMLTEQPSNTLITLPLRKILNKRANQTVAVGNGTEWQSVAANGATVVQPWTTVDGTIQPGQFIQLRSMTSPSAGTTVNAVATINGFTQTVPIRTSIIPTQYLVQGTTVGYFVDPANVPSGVSRITFRAKIRIPSGVSTSNMFTQESTGCDLQLYTNAGTTTGAATVEDSLGAKLLSNVPIITGAMAIPVNTWAAIEYDINLLTGTATATVNNVSNTLALGPGTSTFQLGREVSFLANTSGLAPLPSGSFIADLSVDFNGVRHKTISNEAALANVDPWFRGGSFGQG